MTVNVYGHEGDELLVLHWNLNIYKEPLYDKVLSITNNFLFPSNSKIYEKEP